MGIGKILSEELDPPRFIKEMEDFIGNELHEREEWLLFYSKSALGAGYISNGELDKATDLCHKLEEGCRENYKKTLYYQLSISYFLKEDLETGLKYYEMFKTFKTSAMERKAFNESNTVYLEGLIDYSQGKYDESLAKTLVLLEEASDRSAKVNAHFRLAKVYKALGDTEKQKEHLEYVVEHGNKLHIVKVAREELQALKE